MDGLVAASATRSTSSRRGAAPVGAREQTPKQMVKQVFTTDTNLLRAGAGEANPLLGPLLGSRSVSTLLDEPQHMGDRRRLLPSFHGQRMKDDAAMMDEVAREQIARWPIGEPFELWPQMQAISLEVVTRSVFAGIDEQRGALLRERLVAMMQWISRPRRLALLAAFGSRSITASREFRELVGQVEAVVLEELRERRAQAARASGGRRLAAHVALRRAAGPDFVRRSTRRSTSTAASGPTTSRSRAPMRGCWPRGGSSPRTTVTRCSRGSMPSSELREGTSGSRPTTRTSTWRSSAA